MYKIIKEGKTPIKEFTCDKCNTVFETDEYKMNINLIGYDCPICKHFNEKERNI